MFDSKFSLGQMVREPTSGFEGVVECISFWRYGCTRIGIRATGLDKDGNIKEIIHLDEPAVVAVDDHADEPPKEKKYGPRYDDRR